jgi:hypothetical protein
MSHFLLAVVIDAEAIEQKRSQNPGSSAYKSAFRKLLNEALAPFEESPDDDAYLAFYDETDEIAKQYTTQKVDDYSPHTYQAAEGREDRILHVIGFLAEEDVIVSENDIVAVTSSDKIPERGQKIRLQYPNNHRFVKVIENFETGDDYWIWRVADCTPPQKIPATQRYRNFKEFAEKYYGSSMNEDGRYGFMHNPNAKWDWWELGGRWGGALIQKPEAGGKQCNISTKKDVDIDAMEASERKPAQKAWTEFRMQRESLSGKSYAEIYSQIEALTPEQPFGNSFKMLPEEMREWVLQNFSFAFSYDSLKQLATMSCDEYVECQSAWAPYALLWNGKWYEKGTMGWLGFSSNEEPQWKGTFKELWAQIPEDAVIFMVDCHI